MRKLQEQRGIRLTDDLFELAMAMVTRRNAATISDYLRGLILVDAKRCGESIEGHNLPGWTVATILMLESHKEETGITPRQETRRAKIK